MRHLLPLLSLALVAGTALGAPEGAPKKRPNVLLITADDLNWDSLGVTGCKVPGITPHLDRLAGQGMRFGHAHVTIAVCQPCRSVLMTGRYPHRNGALGFQPIKRDVPTLQESLRAAGYFNGILAKVPHLAPIDKFCWDRVVRSNQLGRGRDPDLYYRHARDFFAEAKKAGKPFFLMANAQDPHRPFAGSQQEKRRKRPGPPWPGVRRTYKPKEVNVPGFLPDIPPVRKEIAQYYTSVHRCDEIVGAVLKALKESGMEGETLVMFLSDHGMALPFAKTNCYLHSTRTPWIVRWPGRVKAGVVDREHFISGIDFMPTVLDALGLPTVEGMDGRSFLPLLMGKEQEGRGQVYTVFHRTAGRRDYPMRSIQDKKYGYIYNAWADGKTVFRNESQNGLTMRAMRKAAETDPRIAARVKLFLYRVPEELYDYEKDPDARTNLANDPAHQDVLARFRAAMQKQMKEVADPLAGDYAAYLKKAGGE
jgi:N-sulfoglucosamine sulfohydrolase